MPVLPIATKDSLVGVKLDAAKDIQADAGTISTKYNGLLNLEKYAVVARGEAKGSQLCVAIGGSAETSENESIAIGYLSRSLAQCSIAVGGAGGKGLANVSEGANFGIALGYNTEVTGARSVALGYESLAADEDVVSVGSPEISRRIVYVKDAAGDNDAVNLGQLRQMLEDQAGAPHAQQVASLQLRIEVLELQLALLLEQKR
ncbi:hypothetical protein [Pseudomonas fluorescens]|uniref:Trimeric autotransporter adhesin YadA-like head domain-containing protein n=1 Tax=Pseudomonas fluorescens TaxID=294 RepID=A0A5E6Y0A9_PSEFL|nr:hypothetical protein [Pseudomonas fluorescens]VVN46495.1 hypothetical protein PS655_05874 [Pseudomonas fluorescens]VVP61064.1 hypothetical protein PS870_06246 [Pseudomonas fluorescens]